MERWVTCACGLLYVTQDREFTSTVATQTVEPGEGSPSDPIQVIALKMYLWPLKVALHSPEGTCHIFIVLSHDPDTRVLLSLGWNATEDTRLLP